MDAVKRIRELMESGNWTEYQLSKKSGLSHSTISNMFKRDTAPTLPTLEAVCKALGVTVVQLLSEEDDPSKLTPEQSELFSKWSTLSDEQKQLILNLMDNMKN